MPGMICAVDGLPDPCPEEFDGSYWAYFTAEAGGEWTARTEGADTADPAPGSFEGWRYNDGSAGPGVETAALADAAAGSAGDEAAAEETSAAGARPTGRTRRARTSRAGRLPPGLPPPGVRRPVTQDSACRVLPPRGARMVCFFP
ncbi:hypothetical protein [Georgenia sp. SUBG003]|uniref:hypothetical protein n=1 Tax=Georgenia sp. SUBG003 TaxID=1497974 RepID=UPI003AB17BFC